MEINTASFGKIDLDESKIIHFQDGIPGFENEKRFTVILNEDIDNPFHYLQSVESEDLSFVIMNPFDIFPEYEFNIPQTSKEKLNIENENQVIVYTIVVVPKDIEKMTTNLQGPIIINTDEKKGKQIILDDNRYTTKHLLFHPNPKKGEI